MLTHPQVKFTSAVKLSEGGAVGPEYTRDEEENFFKRLGKWRSGRRNPSKLHHTEEKDGRPPPPQGAPHPPAHPRPIVPFCPCGVVSCLGRPGLVPSAKSCVRSSPMWKLAACSTLSAWVCCFLPISVLFPQTFFFLKIGSHNVFAKLPFQNVKSSDAIAAP